ncbi:hypothetical protein ARMGADRAFT_1092775 [Armillaria gallica]|uniref:Uncharacterized protein n=1 Tax=Armillaria gallica TaxID=47427 RepID=A0A2H3CEP5_ARMGA|nr:hypothetical protein ARMGADRAFT_1092775 [Armillaria gallica]
MAGLVREVVLAIRAVKILVTELGDKTARVRGKKIKVEVTEKLADAFENALMETMTGIKNKLSHELKETVLGAMQDIRGQQVEEHKRTHGAMYRQALVSGRAAQKDRARLGEVQRQQVQARLAVKERQVRIALETEQIQEITNKANTVLVEELNDILKKMDSSMECRVVAVGKIQEGTELLIKFAITEDAEWIQENCADFYQHVKHLVIQLQTYKIIVMNVSLGFCGDSAKEWTMALLDSKGDYEPGNIVHAQWIKAEHN